MLRCVCLVKCLVIGRDRELKARTKTTTTSSAKNMIRISKTTTLHECITLHCSISLPSFPTSQQQFSFPFIFFNYILCLERSLMSPLSNIEHTETSKSGENICDTFCSYWRCLCSTQGNMMWTIVNFSAYMKGVNDSQEGSSGRTRERRGSKDRKNPTVNYSQIMYFFSVLRYQLKSFLLFHLFTLRSNFL